MKEKDIKAEINRLQSKINGNAEEDNETLQQIEELQKIFEQIEELQKILNKTNGEENNKKTND